MRQILLLLVFFSISFGNYAQQADYVKFSEEFPDTLNRKRAWLVAGSQVGSWVVGVSFLGAVWYKDTRRVPFHFFNDSGEYLDMDKLSHAYACYHIAAKGYHAYRWAGLSNSKAIWYGGLGAFMLWLPIEVFDGLHDSYGFSKGDALANGAGSALFMIQQAVLKEQFIKMKFSFYPTNYKQFTPKYQQLGRITFYGHLYDYNAQTFWLSANLSRIFHKAPSWLNISMGMSAKGMVDAFSNPTVGINGQALPQFERYRQYLFSIDIDLTKIKTRSRFLKKVFNELNILKIPAPTLEYNQLNGWKFRPLYW